MTHTSYRIVIDARLYGLHHTGIGRYVQNLVHQLFSLDSYNEYHLLVADPSLITDYPHNFHLIQASIPHYSLQEQYQIPQIINPLHPDLIHYPHFNVPFRSPQPFIVTIHDLLWNEKIGLSATTLHPIQYLLKYSGYRMVIRHAVRQASRILVPTKYVAGRVQKSFNINPKKIQVTYEAADNVYFSHPLDRLAILNKFNLKKPYIIYAGSLYPHKNVNTLIKSLSFLDDLTLVIVSARNVFAEKTKKFVRRYHLQNRVRFLGFVSDLDLVSLYHYALVLVQPSQSEGFGLTGLEAMASGCPVICTNSDVFQEVYQTNAIYTDTTSPAKLAAAIKKLSRNPANRQATSPKLIQFARTYSWKTLAQNTLSVYHQVLTH